MQRNRLALPLPIGLLMGFSLVLSGVACDEHEHATASDVDEYFYDCDNPAKPATLTVFATDESLIALLNKESAGAIKTLDANAATLSMPAAGSTISAATPPNFILQPPATSARLDIGPATEPHADSPPAHRNRPLWRRAITWLSPIGTAHAHCAPVNGDNFLIRLTREGDSKPAYSALASLPNFTPTAAAWTKAMQGRAGQTLKVTLIRAFYTGGTINDGPFVGTQAASLVVGP